MNSAFTIIIDRHWFYDLFSYTAHEWISSLNVFNNIISYMSTHEERYNWYMTDHREKCELLTEVNFTDITAQYYIFSYFKFSFSCFLHLQCSGAPTTEFLAICRRLCFHDGCLLNWWFCCCNLLMMIFCTLAVVFTAASQYICAIQWKVSVDTTTCCYLLKIAFHWWIFAIYQR